MTPASPLIPDLTGVPVDDDAEPSDADTDHSAGVDLTGSPT